MSSEDNANRLAASFGPGKINAKDLRIVVESVKTTGGLFEVWLTATDSQGDIPISNPCQFRDPNPVAQGGEVARARQMIIDLVQHFGRKR